MLGCVLPQATGVQTIPGSNHFTIQMFSVRVSPFSWTFWNAWIELLGCWVPQARLLVGINICLREELRLQRV